jgi:hypothetical protein
MKAAGDGEMYRAVFPEIRRRFPTMGARRMTARLRIQYGIKVAEWV